MIRNTDGTERLYLSKGDESIYIENCKIPQHHIDGIRFLYKQYRKKKSGVIIYDTSGYGRNLQIVLFIKAMHHLFDKPVLVLCHEGTEHDWVEQFQTWTDLCDDVVLELVKPYIKKRVLINTMSNLAAFSRREWSVVVMDGDRSSQQVLGLTFKADYKIWVTPINMRENLDKFSQIYKWLYPKEKFDKTEFTPDKKDPLDVVDKAVLLDAFMEDIVAMTDEQDSSRILENNQKEEDSPPMKISRKNKDATGTKIKRSKRKICDDEDDAPLSKAKKDPTDEPAQTSRLKTTVSNEDYENAMSMNYETDDFTTYNFKRKSIEEFDEDLLGDKEDSNNLNSPSGVELYYEPDTVTEDNTDKIYEMDTLVLGNTCNDLSPSDIDNIEPTENNISEQQAKNNVNYLDHNDDTPSELDFDTRDDSKDDFSRNSPLNTLEDENDLETTNCTENDDDEQTETTIDEIQLNNNDNKSDIIDAENVDRGSPSVFEMNLDNNEENERMPSTIAEMKLDIDDIESDINELEVSKQSLNKIKSEENEIVNENNVKETKSNCDEHRQDKKNNAFNEVQTDSHVNEVKNESNSVTNKPAPVTKPVKQNCMEEKMKEMEEKALKKFKGSILDNLF